MRVSSDWVTLSFGKKGQHFNYLTFINLLNLPTVDSNQVLYTVRKNLVQSIIKHTAYIHIYPYTVKKLFTCSIIIYIKITAYQYYIFLTRRTKFVFARFV